jgi:hypothetical protein
MKVRCRPEPTVGTVDPPSLTSDADDLKRPERLSVRLVWISRDPLLHFAAAIKAIEYDGSIPQDEQKQISQQLLHAAHVYEVQLIAEARLQSPSQQRKQCQKIAALGARLLKSLGVEDPKLLAYGWPTGKGRSGRRRRARAEKAHMDFRRKSLSSFLSFIGWPSKDVGARRQWTRSRAE